MSMVLVVLLMISFPIRLTGLSTKIFRGLENNGGYPILGRSLLCRARMETNQLNLSQEMV
ncbi:MAG: hypothetical protein O4805_24535 [Trichodesmium sp. St16_bin2-tuft]|nr:hypothetical protein [Trichodesmium sp. St18_bin1]MDE5090120.1 hypothetical protein [Trichodesmium sp. St16_bin2-tuft]MDE5109440.1 hypothetical protein [Trichodesmium sp. St17_bin3_1_1]MDE5123865.1 hypothetical protein [Trichodesmium sp. St19_bin1]